MRRSVTVSATVQLYNWGVKVLAHARVEEQQLIAQLNLFIQYNTNIKDIAG